MELMRKCDTCSLANSHVGDRRIRAVRLYRDFTVNDEIFRLKFICEIGCSLIEYID